MNLLKKSHIVTITDMHGCVFYEYMSYGWRLRAAIYYVLEFLMLRVSDIVLTASQELKQFVARTFRISWRKLQVIENGVELPDIEHIEGPEIEQVKRKLDIRGRRVLVLVAPRNSYSNVLAVRYAQQIMEELNKIRDDVMLLIIGGGKIVNPTPKNMIYTGYVNERTYHLILSCVADVAIMPYPKKAVCGGARNKILDYWAHKVLVISTREGARGITEAKPGVHFILSEYAVNEFARTVMQILEMDEGKRAKVIEEAYNLVKTKWLWKIKAQQLLRLMDEVMGNKCRD
jgi:glycosyltransferase involved in cell wall biosynthesis